MTLPILSLFGDPSAVLRWGVAEWADTMPRLAQSGLTAHAAARVAAVGVGRDDVPAGVRRQFAAAMIASDAQLRSLRWEINEVVRALDGTAIRAVPLKGADYLLRGVTPALGRTVNDLDLLVDRASIDATREAFERAGWELSDTVNLEGGRQLPLMTHSQRQTQLEIHYHLLGEGGSVVFDIAAVLADAQPMRDGVLALLRPEDSVLICVAHFIRNTRSISAFRDLVDFRELIEAFTTERADFGTTLATRAEQVGLGAPLSRIVRDSVALFGPVHSTELMEWARQRAPSLSGGAAFALVPDGCAVPSFGTRLGRVGRMFARRRSGQPSRQTLVAGWSVLFGKEASDE